MEDKPESIDLTNIVNELQQIKDNTMLDPACECERCTDHKKSLFFKHLATNMLGYMVMMGGLYIVFTG